MSIYDSVFCVFVFVLFFFIFRKPKYISITKISKFIYIRILLFRSRSASGSRTPGFVHPRLYGGARVAHLFSLGGVLCLVSNVASVSGLSIHEFRFSLMFIFKCHVFTYGLLGLKLQAVGSLREYILILGYSSTLNINFVRIELHYNLCTT